MKRILVLLICTATFITAYGQDYRWEASLSAGGGAGMIGTVGGARSYFSGIAEVRYTVEDLKWLSFGLAGAIHDVSPSSGDVTDPTYSPEENDPKAKTTVVCNLMLMGYINWYTGEKFKIYSGIGYGNMGGYVKVRGGRTIPAHGPQFIPVGVTFGRRLYGMAELGMGYLYFPARIGIGYRF